MKIGNFELNQNRTFIIAELSANHNGSLETAIETIRAAAKTGANAVKFQTYTADTLTLDCDNEYFKIKGGTLWDGKTLYELYKEAYTPWEWHEELFRVAREEGLYCFSSPFDKSAVDFLEQFDPSAYKIASFEITDIPLIEYAASKQKPIIISTGIATLENIEDAIQACRKVGNEDIVLLKCTSAYPAPLEEVNLNTITDMKKKFNIPIGFSDHTLGTTAPVIAVTLGAKLIEKHFILDHAIGGPDADFSLDYREFSQMVHAVRDTEKLLGSISYTISEKIEKSRQFSRSLFIAEDIKEGDMITEKNIRSVRPGYGAHPKYFYELMGKTVKKNLKFGTPLDLKDIEL